LVAAIGKVSLRTSAFKYCKFAIALEFLYFLQILYIFNRKPDASISLETFQDEHPISDEEQSLAEHEEQLQKILLAYRQQKMREHMAGPLVSFVLHIVLLTLLGALVVGKEQPESLPEIEVMMEEIPIKEIEPPEPIVREIVEDVFEEAPEMDVPMPAVPNETAFEAAFADVIEEAPSTDDNFDLIDVILDVKPIKSATVIRGLYGGRTKTGRKAAVFKNGGKPAGQDAVLRALRWLKRVQQADGSWYGEPGFSGLALLCFLAHGDTPQSEEFGDTVERAMRWLAPQVPVRGASHAYANGIATYAIAEAYGMTKAGVYVRGKGQQGGQDMAYLREAMDRGIGVIVAGQQESGGFGYVYDLGTRWDMSVSGWQFQAMKAAYVSGSEVAGLGEAIQKGKRFLKNVSSAKENGTFGYASVPGEVTGNMTGVGCVSLQLLGEPHAWPVNSGINTLLKHRLPAYQWENASTALYGWYYDTQALFNEGGSSWRRWNDKFQDVLIRSQHAEGYWESPGGPGGRFSGNPGLVFSTTLACLQLEVYYRYLPSFNLDKLRAEAIDPQPFRKDADKKLLDEDAKDDEIEALIIE